MDETNTCFLLFASVYILKAQRVIRMYTKRSRYHKLGAVVCFKLINSSFKHTINKSE